MLIADSNESVHALKQRARADLILDGTVDVRREVALHGDGRAGVGDMIITRKNDRRLDTQRGWVRNDDRWIVTDIRGGGTLIARCAELSAHEMITAEQEAWGSIAQLAAEYETIAQAAQHDRFATHIRQSGPTPDEAEDAFQSDTFGALTTELRLAEANHHNIDALMRRLVAARGFDDADGIASILHHRRVRATARPAGSSRTRKVPD